MSQSRRASLLEAFANVLFGYWIAIGAQMLIFPLFGLQVSLSDNLLIGVLFTFVSLVRSYLLRRFFNLFH